MNECFQIERNRTVILSERVIFLRVNHRHTKRKERASESGKSPSNTIANKNAPASKVREKKSKNETLGCPRSKWKRKKERGRKSDDVLSLFAFCCCCVENQEE